MLLLVAQPMAAKGLPPGYGILYLSPGADEAVAQAAGDLASLLRDRFGEAPEIRRQPLLGGSRGIRIGPAPAYPVFDGDPLTDEIVIARGPDGLRIHGSDNLATCFAIHRFARDFLGWRQYQPGDLGRELLDEPPSPPAQRGERKILLHERADWHSRNPAMRGGPESREWSVWHGLRERFHYNHTLHRALPPVVFDTHPGWFAKDAEGNPMRPPYYPQIHGYNDHPDLSHPAVREHAARATLESLARETALQAPHPDSYGVPMSDLPVRASPGIVSTSIGLGDSFVFGHFPEEYPWKPEGYFRRWPDWSNHVFAYSNEVASRIAEAWSAWPWDSPEPRPELYLGVLAYLSWEKVPDFPLHPAILPYLTYDRSQWHDPEARADDLANVEAWTRTGAPFLGTWDYLFGYGFLLPRSLSGIVADSIPALHRRGVRAYYSQVLPLWPFDGHTNWLTARLLWKSDQSAETLLEEYFAEFYGPAAPAMRAFFDTAEQLWMDQKGRGWWLRYWKDPWQAALWTPAILEIQEDRLREAARAALDLSPESLSGPLSPDRFLRRVDQTRKLFSLTRTFLEYQWQAWAIQSGEWEAADRDELERGLAAAEAALAGGQTLREELARLRGSGPLTGNLLDDEWIFRYDALGAAVAGIGLRALELGPDGKGLLPQVNSLLTGWARLRDIPAPPSLSGRSREILYDNLFARAGDPRIWHRQFMDSEGSRRQAASEEGRFTATNVRRGHLYQLFKAEPGEAFLGLLEVDSEQSPSGEIYIRIDFFDAENRLLTSSPRSRIAPVQGHGSRQTLRALAVAPPEAVHGRLFIRFYELDAGAPATVRNPRVLLLEQ